MPVNFRSKLSSAVANQTWLDKTQDDATIGIVALNSTDITSGATISNIQGYTNEIASSTGIDFFGDPNGNVYSSENYISNGDNRKVAIGKLDAQVKVNEDGITAINDSVNASNGICPLDGDAKVPIANIPDSLLGAMIYQGTWNANTNTPTLASGVGEKGHYYIVSVAGSTDLDGITDWLVGDYAVYNGAAWEQIDNTDAVLSVNGQTGAVVLTKTDVGLSDVTNDAQLKRSEGDFDTFAEKVVVDGNDWLLIEDSADSLNKKKIKKSALGDEGANKSLSNLTSPTSINQNLEPSDLTKQLGSAAKPWVAIRSVQDLYYDFSVKDQTGLVDGGNGGFSQDGTSFGFKVESVGLTGTSRDSIGVGTRTKNDASSTGDSLIYTGSNNGTGNTGDIIIKTGTPTSGTRGNVNIDASIVDLNSTIVKNGVDPVDPQDLATRQFVLDNAGGGGGGSFVWEENGVTSPYKSTFKGISLFDFDDSSNAELYALVVVPDSYKVGDQIILQGSKFFINAASGNVLFKCDTELVKNGADITGVLDLHTSSNTELTMTTTNVITDNGNLTLTDGVGEINSVPVAIGDTLIIRLYRDNTNETSSAVGDARFLKFSASINFGG